MDKVKQAYDDGYREGRRSRRWIVYALVFLVLLHKVERSNRSAVDRPLRMAPLTRPNPLPDNPVTGDAVLMYYTGTTWVEKRVALDAPSARSTTATVIHP